MSKKYVPLKRSDVVRHMEENKRSIITAFIQQIDDQILKSTAEGHTEFSLDLGRAVHKTILRHYRKQGFIVGEDPSKPSITIKVNHTFDNDCEGLVQ